MSVCVHVYGHCTLQGRYRDFTDFSEVYKWFKFSSDILSYVVELKFHLRFTLRLWHRLDLRLFCLRCSWPCFH